MIINYTLNKSTLENFLQQNYNFFGKIFINVFLDSLKNLGYFFSTSSGASITSSDLKIPFLKNTILTKSSFDIETLELIWQNGKITEIEKCEFIYSHWEKISTYIKDSLLTYYSKKNSLNIVYIMAFSGARGNVSQLRQMVGIRGLMINQDGDLISIPVLTNFKEGLSIVDFITSSYGARKGVIDTALKTADSGYLTRKLVYLMQNIIIKEKQCNSKNSILITINSDLLLNLIGKTFLSLKYKDYYFKNTKNLILTEKIIIYFLEKSKFINYVEIKSPITCISSNAICQTCYGWDLTKKKNISLGDAVGILSAQTIGEPGTQMTMRTFHMGGVFLGENFRYTFANTTGKVKFINSKNLLSIQNKFGLNMSYIPKLYPIYFITWENKKKNLILKFFCYKYLFNFLKKNEPITEENISLFSIFFNKNLYFRPIYSQLNGYLKILKQYKKYCLIKNCFFKYFKNFNFRKFNDFLLTMFDNHSYQINSLFFKFPLNIKCYFFTKNIKIFQFKNDINFFKFNRINLKKSFGKLKVASKEYGLTLKKKNNVYIKKTIFNYDKFKIMLKKKYLIIFTFFLSKTQYIDKKTILFTIYIIT